jgi:HK97 gp10 family phage protein
MITARVEGMAELRAKLRKMELRAPGLIAEALKKAAKPMEDYAVGAAPVASGSLARSIHTRAMPSTSPGHATVRIGPAWAIYGGGGVEYGRFVEFGTSRMAAQPFLRPALDVGADEALHIFAAELKRGLR